MRVRWLPPLALVLTLAVCAHDPDRAIRQTIEQLTLAEARHDGQKFSEQFTADGEISDQGNIRARGRDQIKALIEPAHPWSEQFGPVYRIEQIRLISAQAAIVDALRSQAGPVLARQSACLFILVKDGGEWRVARLAITSAGVAGLKHL